MIEVDGSFLEGGGQILRIALSLSCLLNVPVRVTKIRAGRPKPGLSAQHLQGVLLLKAICNASVTGAVPGSQELEFKPERIVSGRFSADTHTAGSIALLLQVALPVAHFGNGITTLELIGGTNAMHAPQIDFMTEIFRPNLEKFGATFDFELFQRGYFPRGGGRCEIVISPVKKIDPWVNVEFGMIKKYFGWSFAAGSLPLQMAVGIAAGCRAAIDSQNTYKNEPIEIETYKERPEVAESNATGIIVGCETSTSCILGGSALGVRGVKFNETGAKAAKEVIDCIGYKACVDSYVQDQIILYMALADGRSRIRTVPITMHTKTAIHVVEQMTKARFKMIDVDNGAVILECDGIGLTNRYL